jgi:hypothetical protein
VKPAFYGLERVPGEAWTEDGMSNSSAFDVDLSVPVKEWDGTAETTTELSAVTVHLKANNGWNWKRDYVPMYNLVNAYLDDGGDRAQITVTGIPYRIYDVIVYTCTDTSETKFGPVTVNGTPYRWSASNGATEPASGADSTAATRWGFSRARLPEYGANALRVEGRRFAPGCGIEPPAILLDICRLVPVPAAFPGHCRPCFTTCHGTRK